MNVLCVIPSRIGSTRLPRKPLLEIQGKAMIQRVYENASCCSAFTKVIVATDSEEIASVIQKCGGHVEMTSADLPTGSDRVAAVAAQHPDIDVVVNLQGDEPFVKPKMLEELLFPYLSGQSPDMTTLARPLKMRDLNNADVVKVITDVHQRAIYFSRSPIPYFRQIIQVPVYHHIGLYAFRRDFLMQYTKLTPTPLEQAEALEQLRALEHGYQIRVCLTGGRSLEINTPDELVQAQQFEYVE